MEEKQNQEVVEITQRIAELRDACGYTPEEFAAKLNIPLETYLAYEHNASIIPVSQICNIANLCGVDLSEIMTGVSAKLKTIQIVRSGEGESMERYPGYHLKDLACRFSGKVMQPILVRLDPNDPPPTLARHGGQEFNFVLEGVVDLHWDGKVFPLYPGDCVYFDPAFTHGQSCGSESTAQFLTIIAES